MTRVVRISVAALAFWLLLALMPAPQAGAPRGKWAPLLSPRHTELARVTYYGARYDDGAHYCASGQLYYANAPIVALGPAMLAQARALSGEHWPLVRLRFADGWVYVARVADTGAPELEVDLPDATWQAVTGLDPAVGVAYAEVDVMILEVRGGVAVVNGQIGGRP